MIATTVNMNTRRNEAYRISRLPRGEDSPNWRGEKATDYSKRKRCRVDYPTLDGVTCERCGKAPAVDRHHRDSNVENNGADNILCVCRRCHMELDGRLERLSVSVLRRIAERGWGWGDVRVVEPRPCSNCHRPYKPLRKGRCYTCDRHWREKGFERPLGRKRGKQPPTPAPCSNCGEVTQYHRSLGLCRRCYTYQKRHHEPRPKSFPPKPPVPCSVCGRPTKPTCRGRCSSCYHFWLRTGKERTAQHIAAVNQGGKYRSPTARSTDTEEGGETFK